MTDATSVHKQLQEVAIVKKTKSNRGGYRGGGRPKGSLNKTAGEIKAIAQSYGADAIKRAAELAGLVYDNNGNRTGVATSEKAQISALNIVLERAYGKAPQALTGEDGGPVKQILEVVWAASSARAS